MGCSMRLAGERLSSYAMRKKLKLEDIIPPAPRIPLRLREHREKLGWSQQVLADALGTSDATINRIELGKQNWKQDFLQRAAKALDCSWRDLLPTEPGSIEAMLAALSDERRKMAEEMIHALYSREAA